MKKPQLASATAVALPAKQTWPKDLSKTQLKLLQQALNTFFKKYLNGTKPLMVDGKIGPATRKRIRYAKYYLGQYRPTKGFDTRVNRQFMRRLGAPNNARLVIGKHPQAVVNSGQRRRKTHNTLAKASTAHWSGHPGVVVYDGVQIANYLPVINDWARHTGWNGIKWKGHVVSGFRTPALCTHLCIAMCGRPTCPGRCAGATSNHCGFDPTKTPTGAEDVSDYQTFRLLMSHCPFDKLGAPKIFNNLPIDPVHFSPHGN